MSLFDSTVPLTPDVTIPDNAYETLVGEGKKFKDNELLAKSVFHKDAHIARLEAEARDKLETIQLMQAELKAQAKMADMESRILAAVNQPPSSIQEPPVVNGTEKPPAFDPEQLERLLDEKLNQRSQEGRKQTNLNAVEAKLTEAYGNQAALKLRQEAASLGVSEAFLKSVAGDNPNAFFRLIGLDGKVSFETPLSVPRSSVETSSFKPAMAGDRTEKYYKELKRTNPALYHSRETAIQMDKDGIRLGEAFFDV